MFIKFYDYWPAIEQLALGMCRHSPLLYIFFFISIPISIVKIEILCAQVASSFSEKWPEILTRNWSSFWWLCSRLHFVLVIQFTFSKC